MAKWEASNRKLMEKYQNADKMEAEDQEAEAVISGIADPEPIQVPKKEPKKVPSRDPSPEPLSTKEVIKEEPDESPEKPETPPQPKPEAKPEISKPSFGSKPTLSKPFGTKPSIG